MKPARPASPAAGGPLLRGCANWLLVPLLLACTALLLPLASVLSASAQTPAWLPFSLHSVLSADYSPDSGVLQIPALEIKLIEEVIRDQASRGGEARYAEVERGLDAPVPTVTPRYPGEDRPPGVQPPQATPAAPSPTSTGRPTRTPWPSATATPYPTDEPSPTGTAAPTMQPSPTPRPVKPTTTQPPPRPRPTDPPTQAPKPTNPPPTERPPDPPPYPPPDTDPQPPPNPYP